MTSNRTIRFGVMGTARIAAKVVKAIQSTRGAKVVAVASRSSERAAVWAKQHGVPHSYGDYQSLLENDELDAIYIPLPPSLHAQWTIRCAEAGKHVLCEKPLAMNAAQALEMASACRENQVQLMDAVMWVHHPRAAEMLRRIRDGSLGELRRVTSAFSFMIEPYLLHNPAYPACDPNTGQTTLASAIAHEIRLQRDLGGGALFDLGWYCVRASLWAFGETPERVFATARYRDDVDFDLSAVLWFSGERMASFDCSYDAARRKWLEVAGTAGSLVCDDFVQPTDITRPRFWIHDDQGRVEEKVSSAAIQQECMIEHFCNAIGRGELNQQRPQIAIDNQRVCDAIGQSARRGEALDLDNF